MKSAAEVEEEMMCCAACGIAEVDDIKLKKCTACKLCSVKCQKEHRPKHKKHVKKGRLSCVSKFCSSNPKAAISVNAQFVVCRYLLIQNSLLSQDVAAKSFVEVVSLPTPFERRMHLCSRSAHSAGTRHQTRRKKLS